MAKTITKQPSKYARIILTGHTSKDQWSMTFQIPYGSPVAKRYKIMEEQEPGILSLLISIIADQLEVPSCIPISSFLLLAAIQHEIARIDHRTDAGTSTDKEDKRAGFLRRHAAILCGLESIVFLMPDGPEGD